MDMPTWLVVLAFALGIGVLIWWQRTRTTADLGPTSASTGWGTAQHGCLQRYVAALGQSHERDLMGRYATLKFDLPVAAQEALRGAYSALSRDRPMFPFDLAEIERHREGLVAALRDSISDAGVSPRADSVTALRDELEVAVARRAHLAVLDAIAPHLRTDEERETWTALRAMPPLVVG